jgi:ParB family chromosome partitioning protein
VLIAGHRRWEAARQAGLSRIPVVLKEASPREMLELALVENVQRADLNPLEEAAAYHQLVEEFGLTQEEVARRVGRSRPSVTNTLRLLGLPELVRIAVARGELTEGHARALLGAGSEDSLLSTFRVVTSRGLNVRQTEELVRRRVAVTEERDGRRLGRSDPEARRVEEMFREALGTRVELTMHGEGGRLVIHFYNAEQLQAIYDAMARGVGEGSR